MTDLFDRQHREKELRDFESVWPGDDAISIASEFRAAYKEATGRDAPAVTSKDGVFTVHFISAVGSHEYTAKEIKEATFRLKSGTTLAVQP